MLRNLTLSLIVVCAGFCGAEEDDLWAKCGEIVIPACRSYIKAFASEKEVEEWNKKITDRIQQKVADTGADEESAFRSIALDWANDNRSKLEQKDKKVIKWACLLFLRFWDRKIAPPSQIREHLGVRGATDLADYLKDETEMKLMVKDPLKTPKTKAEAVPPMLIDILSSQQRLWRWLLLRADNLL